MLSLTLQRNSSSVFQFVQSKRLTHEILNLSYQPLRWQPVFL
jgi:hypothetical protein